MKPYYKDDFAEIWHGDCRDILPTLPKCDLLLTDPPYEISTSGGGIGGRRDYLKEIRGHIDMGFDLTMLRTFKNWFCFCSKTQLPAFFAELSADDRWML